MSSWRSLASCISNWRCTAVLSIVAGVFYSPVLHIDFKCQTIAKSPRTLRAQPKSSSLKIVHTLNNDH